MILGSGCFDGLHAGHARYLAALKRLAHPGEPVYVAVAPDAYIDAHKKRRPHWSQADRWRAVLECGVRAIPHQEPSVAAEILRLRPRVFVKGSDWAGRLPADVLDACREAQTLIVYVETPGTHTSEAVG